MSSTESVAKYNRLAGELEALLREGRWEGGRVPSVREIAERHRVSVVTVSRALQVLRDKGLILTVERSGCFVAPRAVPTAERFALCLNVTPGPYQAASRSVNQAGFDDLARRAPLHFDPAAIDGHADPAEVARQAKVAADAGVKGVFLLPARLDEEGARRDEAVLAACEAAGLPVVLLERNLRGERSLARDLAAWDDADAGRQLTRHLLGRGRRRVAFLTGSPTSSHLDRTAGYLVAAHAGGMPPTVLTLADGRPDREGMVRACDELVAAGADAVVCFSDYIAFGVILELLRRGVNVPRDVAVAGFDDLPIGNTFTVGVTTIAFPSAAAAEEAMGLMRRRLARPDAPFVKLSVPGRLVVRESTGEAT